MKGQNTFSWYSVILTYTDFRGYLTHSHTMTPFDAPGKQAFWKHWEKKKLLVTSNFTFSHSVFYLFG